MNLLQLVPIYPSAATSGARSGDLRMIEKLGPPLSQRLGVPWDILNPGLEVSFALHEERQQYYSTEILEQMQSLQGPQTWRILGVTDCDLYIPILTFVFGEAQMGGRVAIVSSHRLRQEFYGLAADDELFLDRLLKEGLHELGHTLELRHCEDYRCAMASSHAVEWIDLKEAAFCPRCGEKAVFKPAAKKRLWPF